MKHESKSFAMLQITLTLNKFGKDQTNYNDNYISNLFIIFLRMEVGVQLVGILLRVLNFLLAPLFWLRARDNRRLPPATNPILLKSASELAAAIRSGEVSTSSIVFEVKLLNPRLTCRVSW